LSGIINTYKNTNIQETSTIPSVEEPMSDKDVEGVVSYLVNKYKSGLPAVPTTNIVPYNAPQLAPEVPNMNIIPSTGPVTEVEATAPITNIVPYSAPQLENMTSAAAPVTNIVPYSPPVTNIVPYGAPQIENAAAPVTNIVPYGAPQLENAAAPVTNIVPYGAPQLENAAAPVTNVVPYGVPQLEGPVAAAPQAPVTNIVPYGVPQLENATTPSAVPVTNIVPYGAPQLENAAAPVTNIVPYGVPQLEGPVTAAPQAPVTNIVPYGAPQLENATTPAAAPVTNIVPYGAPQLEGPIAAAAQAPVTNIMPYGAPQGLAPLPPLLPQLRPLPPLQRALQVEPTRGEEPAEEGLKEVEEPQPPVQEPPLTRIARILSKPLSRTEEVERTSLLQKISCFTKGNTLTALGWDIYTAIRQAILSDASLPARKAAVQDAIRRAINVLSLGKKRAEQVGICTGIQTTELYKIMAAIEYFAAATGDSRYTALDAEEAAKYEEVAGSLVDVALSPRTSIYDMGIKLPAIGGRGTRRRNRNTRGRGRSRSRRGKRLNK
jgi:hypothetical protein